MVASRRWRPGPHARRRCAGAGTERVARAAVRPHPDCASSPGAPGRKIHWLGSLDPNVEASAAGAAGYRSRRSPCLRAHQSLHRPRQSWHCLVAWNGKAGVSGPWPAVEPWLCVSCCPVWWSLVQPSPGQKLHPQVLGALRKP